ncbi:MAG: type II toxin-antitoxin system YafQ family toxin [Oscillospiraceae bacterium]|nr:type II toxin-antitoxin system YafQ family toxin [Oscillospiraceae bacterium]
MTETKRNIRRTTQFKKEYKKSKKQGKDMTLVLDIINMLANDEPLPEKHFDHALTGNWIGFRECHVNPDWLLVYQKPDDGELLLVLTRLTSHSNLNF